MTVPGTAPEAIRVRDLSVTTPARRLLDRAELSVAPGQLVLLVGGSGSGKSVLLKLLAGLADPLSGGLEVRGEVRTTGRVGMVFQNGALLDDLSAIDNVRFALDHGGRPPSREEAARLLQELRVPPDVVLSTASGGQRRRVAIARALANRPEILLYDEPTTGLDPDLAIQVGKVIRETHDRGGMTTLVVTHDFHALAGIADRIVFLDPGSLLLTDVRAEDLARLVETGAFRSEAEKCAADPAARPPSFVALRLARVGRGSLAAMRSIAGSLVPRWKRPAWALRFARHYLRLVAGPTSLLYVSLAGAVVGFVAVYFSFQYLPYAEYVRPLVTEELLGAIGFALYRILVPILATILVAARCGAAVASDLAGRVYREEYDALRTLGASPAGYHGFTSLASLVVSTPLLVFVSFLVARATALATYGVWDPSARLAWLDAMFHAELVNPGRFYAGTPWVLAKGLTCGLVIGLTALGLGSTPKRTPSDVSAAVTQTVLVATALVLLVHFAYAFFEF